MRTSEGLERVREMERAVQNQKWRNRGGERRGEKYLWADRKLRRTEILQSFARVSRREWDCFLYLIFFFSIFFHFGLWGVQLDEFRMQLLWDLFCTLVNGKSWRTWNDQFGSLVLDGVALDVLQFEGKTGRMFVSRTTVPMLC